MAELFPHRHRRFIVIEPADKGFTISVWLAPWWAPWWRIGETMTLPTGREALDTAMKFQSSAGTLICHPPALPGGRA